MRGRIWFFVKSASSCRVCEGRGHASLLYCNRRNGFEGHWDL